MQIRKCGRCSGECIELYDIHIYSREYDLVCVNCFLEIKRIVDEMEGPEVPPPDQMVTSSLPGDVSYLSKMGYAKFGPETAVYPRIDSA